VDECALVVSLLSLLDDVIFIFREIRGRIAAKTNLEKSRHSVYLLARDVLRNRHVHSKWIQKGDLWSLRARRTCWVPENSEGCM
jgi:hypothetical protein